ncbi:hypothetical protein [Mesorhizobium sp.]
MNVDEAAPDRQVVSNSEIASLIAAKEGVGGTPDWPWPGRSGAMT